MSNTQIRKRDNWETTMARLLKEKEKIKVENFTGKVILEMNFNQGGLDDADLLVKDKILKKRR